VSILLRTARPDADSRAARYSADVKLMRPPSLLGTAPLVLQTEVPDVQIEHLTSAAVAK
jgi:hypothetical protein